MPLDESHTNGLDGVATNGQSAPSSAAACWGDDSSTTELDPPELPYAGFTWAEVGIIAGVGFLLAAVSIVGMLTSPCCAPAGQTEMMRRVAADLTPLLLWTLSAFPIFWACARLRPRHFGCRAVVAGHLALAFGVTFAAELGQNVIYSGIVTLWPPSDPPDFTTQPIEMLTNLEFLGGLVPYFILLIIGLGRYEYLHSRKRQEQAQQLKREADQLRAQLTSARLEALRMQINPHFLFNTLHMVSTMAEHNPEGVQKATARLSEMLRYALSTSDQQEVPLDKELDMLDSYLEIQKLRLDERLETRVDVEPGVRQALVPTLLLQPLAENAVKHGFEGSDAPSYLKVRATREEETLVLRVSDNGAGLTDGSDPVASARRSVQSEERHGLQNIAERLDGLYGEAASLRFERSERGGLAVVIRLPFHTREATTNLRVAAVEAK